MFDDLSHAIFVDGLAYYSNMLGLPTAVTGILANGLGTGINTVLGFIPQIGFYLYFYQYSKTLAICLELLLLWIDLCNLLVYPAKLLYR